MEGKTELALQSESNTVCQMLVAFPFATVKERLSPAQRNTLECEPTVGIVISIAKEIRIGCWTDPGSKCILIVFSRHSIFSIQEERQRERDFLERFYQLVKK